MPELAPVTQATRELVCVDSITVLTSKRGREKRSAAGDRTAFNSLKSTTQLIQKDGKR